MSVLSFKEFNSMGMVIALVKVLLSPFLPFKLYMPRIFFLLMYSIFIFKKILVFLVYPINLHVVDLKVVFSPSLFSL